MEDKEKKPRKKKLAIKEEVATSGIFSTDTFLKPRDIVCEIEEASRDIVTVKTLLQFFKVLKYVSNIKLLPQKDTLGRYQFASITLENATVEEVYKLTDFLSTMCKSISSVKTK